MKYELHVINTVPKISFFTTSTSSFTTFLPGKMRKKKRLVFELFLLNLALMSTIIGT